MAKCSGKTCWQNVAGKPVEKMPREKPMENFKIILKYYYVLEYKMG